MANKLTEAEWQSIDTAPLNVAIDTVILDKYGARNFQALVQKVREPGCRPLWWFEDGSMYVYYTPTHWRPRSTLAGGSDA